VPVKVLPQVVRAIYRVALDVSFRRTGALFVLLRNRQNRGKLVVPGDGIGDARRESLHALFDETLTNAKVQTLSRAVLAELASIDGGVVMDNQGFLLAYGSVLKTSGRFNPSEGSRTKAAVSASRFGISVKVSSDGDIVFFAEGRPFLEL
jgi:DNA integrity scanning protein DisA with diadenylate cyclase activity